ncbi:hypothetical protein KSP35_14150 [Aquihabitans sp. G128]|uniref:hypothetical protein n=1 Tax=Aquihabitans sp. G128 TaxID=2849779 RepID=UPI001C21296C|nr:hypothetical protein [Aquihabitans sp. G128]QXC59526.1 hypothetical protein KSP35_14150 [Aquihabitans sp. G128]
MADDRRRPSFGPAAALIAYVLLAAYADHRRSVALVYWLWFQGDGGPASIANAALLTSTAAACLAAPVVRSLRLGTRLLQWACWLCGFRLTWLLALGPNLRGVYLYRASTISLIVPATVLMSRRVGPSRVGSTA